MNSLMQRALKCSHGSPFAVTMAHKEGYFDYFEDRVSAEWVAKANETRTGFAFIVIDLRGSNARLEDCFVARVG